MTHDFDRLIDRRPSGSVKWHYYPPDVLPLWVADMDFLSPEPVIRALRERVEHGIFGYELPPAELSEVVCARLQRLYGWQVKPEHFVYLPGLVTGLNMVCRAYGRVGEPVAMLTPAYPPFLSAPASQGLEHRTLELVAHRSGQGLSYQVDFDALETEFASGARLFLHCHPHNPTGHTYSRPELERLAEICLRHDVIMCSDEIHCDLLLGGTQHLPLAAVAPEVAARTVTLMAPSKTFNLPGLGCSFAIVPDTQLRQQLQKAGEGLLPLVNLMGLVAAQAAYREGDAWLADLRTYLTANREALLEFAARHLPQVALTRPQATYLAWLDFRESNLPGGPYEFFLQRAKVGLSDGATFGPGGQGFVRLNFGCPRATLMEALERMRAALTAL